MTKSRNIIQRHGLRLHPLYRVWTGMKTRCYNNKSKPYKNYGGRGISVCGEWVTNFKAFYDWAIINGYKKGLQLDRYPNNDGNYEPNNCRFATRVQNCNNKRSNKIVSINGIGMTLSEACRKLGKNYKNISMLMSREGLSFEKAAEYVKKPPPRGNKCHFSKLNIGDVLKIKELYVPRKFPTRKLAKMYGVSQAAICHILNGKNWATNGR